MEKNITICIDEFDSSAELNKPDQELLAKAQTAINLAYAPYSNFYVGAAIRLDNGTIILGSNQENASFSATICAERVALSTLSSISPNCKVIAIAITYNSNRENQGIVAPCGVCRQSLFELEDRNQSPIKVILSSPSGKIVIFKSIADTLPLHFSSSSLK